MLPKILIFTRNQTLRSALRDGLRKKGFEVSVTSSRNRVLNIIAGRRTDILIVDGANAPQEELAFCLELRRLDGDVHILVSTPARHSAAHVDACIVAPITIRKVQNRLRSLLKDDARHVIVAGDVSLDTRTRIVRCCEREARLTPKEARLLRLFLERPGAIISRAEIMREVWDTEYLGDMRTMDVHIRWLRRKIEPMSSQPTYICTVRGRGYCFDPSPRPAQATEVVAEARPREEGPVALVLSERSET